MIGDTTLRAELFVDPHSFSSPAATVTHLEWDAEVDFDAQEIHATAVWTLSEAHGDQVVFDTKALQIESVLLDGQEAQWSFGAEDDLLGAALIVYDLSPASKEVSHYLFDDRRCRSRAVVSCSIDTRWAYAVFIYTESSYFGANVDSMSRPSWRSLYL